MIVRPVTPKDASAWVDLRRALWPGQESEHAAEVSLLQKGPVVADSDRLDLVTVFATGYLVQAWLFETHRALGGLGYQVTMVGVSALVWTLLILGLAVIGRLLRRLVL